jgi:hypothetical protein
VIQKDVVILEEQHSERYGQDVVYEARKAQSFHNIFVHNALQILCLQALLQPDIPVECVVTDPQRQERLQRNRTV